MPATERIYYLFNRCIEETADPAELEELRALLNDISYEGAMMDRLVDLLRETIPLAEHSEARWKAVLRGAGLPLLTGSTELPSTTELPSASEWSSTTELPSLLVVTSETPALSPRRLPLIRRWWAIAALFIGGLVAVWLLSRTPAAQPAVARLQSRDRAPGRNIAVLTLADGSRITLDSTHNGVLAQQGNSRVTKLKDGNLIYKTLDEKPAAVVFNTLSTPRGGQYRLLLPDGSQAWLNAASSITYPTAFMGGERKVSVTGEVYLEIEKNPAMPFRVKVATASGQEEVEVLGTHFNVKAYGDEAVVMTTLLEGSVRLVSKGGVEMLQPGQQGQLRSDGRLYLVDHVDIDEVMAWKNGLFHFEDADISEVMRQIARWYDVEVVFEGKVPVEKFDGEIPRNSNLTEVLKILQLSNVHFKIEDKKVTVTP